jgi:hypothetical protein
MNDSTMIQYTELIAQPYSNIKISAGLVSGAEPDTVYLKLERFGPPGEPDCTELLLRPDELAAIAWCATGVLWSVELARLDDDEEATA